MKTYKNNYNDLRTNILPRHGDLTITNIPLSVKDYLTFKEYYKWPLTIFFVLYDILYFIKIINDIKIQQIDKLTIISSCVFFLMFFLVCKFWDYYKMKKKHILWERNMRQK